jgi:hypothetical protein
MDLSGFALNLPGVKATRLMELREQREREAAMPSGAGRAAYQLASIFGDMAGRKHPSAAMRAAQVNEIVQGQYARDMEEGLAEEGADPIGVNLRAMTTAARNLREAGSVDEAANLEAQIFQVRVQKQVRDAELSKLYAATDRDIAETGRTVVETDNVGKGNAAELERLTLRMEDQNLSAASKATLQRRIDKLNTITGTTPDDPGARGLAITKPEMGKLQEEFASGRRNRDLLRSLKSGYNPQLDNILGRAETMGLGLKDLLGQVKDPQEVQRLTQGVSQNAVIAEQFNSYIKEKSGATVPVAEIPRLSKASLAPNDPPTVKKAKIAWLGAYAEADARRLQAAMAQDDLTVLYQPIQDFMTPEEKAVPYWDAAPGAAPAAAAGKAAADMSDDELNDLLDGAP